MVLDLSSIWFTDQDDIVPESGYDEQILNTGIVDTYAGNDRITGIGTNIDWDSYGFKNEGILNTADGDDRLTGIGTANTTDNNGFENLGVLNTDDGNDIIIGSGQGRAGGGSGIYNIGTLNAGEGNDRIDGLGYFTHSPNYNAIYNIGTLNAGGGNDTISGEANLNGLINSGTLDTGEGNDIITASGYWGVGILNNFEATINTGNDEDSIISDRGFINGGGVFLGDGNDSISANGGRYDSDFSDFRGLENSNTIETGDGHDIITSYYVIYNEGIINTGNGDDVIIANNGFESGLNSSEAWFLGEGEDYIKGFGSGDFYGGNGLDILELTPGSYTFGIGGEVGESSTFTKGNQLMITSEFEILLAGGTFYDFASLTAGQIIVVA